MIVKQGTRVGDNDHFFIIEKGTVECSKQDPNDDSSPPLVAMRLGRGGYFGELALLVNQPRQASVTAVGGPVKCLAISKKHFTEVMGPVRNFLRGRMSMYASYAELREKSSVDNGSQSASEDVPSPTPGTPVSTSGHDIPGFMSPASILDLETMIIREKDFNNVLRKLVDVYRASLAKRAAELKISDVDMDILFPGFVELLQASDQLLQRFPEESAETASTSAWLQQVEALVPLFRPYLKSFYASSALRKKRSTIPSFSNWVDSCDNQAQCEWSSLLKMPLKRLGEHSKFALGVIQSGLAPETKEGAKRVKRQCHDMERIRANAEKVYTIQKNIVGEVDFATDPNRTYVAEGELTKLDSGESLVGFLFNDLLVLTRAVPIGGGKIKATHFASITLATVSVLEPRGDFAGKLVYRKNEQDHVLNFRCVQSQWLQRLFDAFAAVTDLHPREPPASAISNSNAMDVD